MPSTSHVARVDDIELQEIVENTARSMGNLITHHESDSSENLPMHELQGLDSSGVLGAH